MEFKQHTIQLATTQPIEIINITDSVQAFVKEAGLTHGLLHVGSAHTTVGLAINEECSELRKDWLAFLQRLAPAGADYFHDRVAVDGRPNAHSHLLSTVLPSQLTIVLQDGVLALGTWQSVFAIDLDGPRPNRKIHLTVMGA